MFHPAFLRFPPPSPPASPRRPLALFLVFAWGCAPGNGGCAETDQAGPLPLSPPAATVLENALQTRITNTGWNHVEARVSDLMVASLGDHVCIKADDDVDPVSVTSVTGVTGTAHVCPSAPLDGSAPTCDGSPGCRIALTSGAFTLRLDQSGNSAIVLSEHSIDAGGTIPFDIDTASTDSGCSAATTTSTAALSEVLELEVSAASRRLFATLGTTNDNDIIAKTVITLSGPTGCNLNAASRTTLKNHLASLVRERIAEALGRGWDDIIADDVEVLGLRGTVVSTSDTRPPAPLMVAITPGGYVRTETALAAVGTDPAKRGLSYGGLGAFNSDVTILDATDGRSTPHPCIAGLPLPEPGMASPFVTGQRLMARVPELAKNLRPDGAAYDAGVAISTAWLDTLAFHHFNSGRLCLEVHTSEAQPLAVQDVAAALPSLAPFASPNAALSLQLHPQSPPRVTLGSGVVGDPLLQVAIDDLGLNVIAVLDERPTRIMSATVSFRVGFSVRADEASNALIATVDPSFSRGATGTITHAELLTEDAAALETALPALVELVIPELAKLVGPVALPSIVGLTLDLSTVSFARLTASDETMLAVFGDITLAAPTNAGAAPSQALKRSRRAALDTTSTGAVETLDPPTGAQSAEGCSAGGGAPSWLAIVGILLACTLRHGRRHRLHAAALACLVLTGCGGCGDARETPCTEDVACEDTRCVAPQGPVCLPEGVCGCELLVLTPGVTGRFVDVAADGTEAVVVAYNETYGDLMLARVTPPLPGSGVTSVIVSDFAFIDGVPTSPVVAEPSGVRGGIADPGDDVGRDASVVVDASGNAHIAYLDVTHRDLRYARVGRDGVVQITLTVDADTGSVGRHPDIILGATGKPQIAYAADDAGLQSQLRFTAAEVALPQSATDWSAPLVIASGPVLDTQGVSGVPRGMGFHASMALRADGRTRIQFADTASGDLLRTQTSSAAPMDFAELATEDDPNDPADGGVTTIDRTGPGADLGRIGRYATLTIDASDGLHQAQLDETRGALTYLGPASGFAFENVDTGLRAADVASRIHQVGTDAALVLADVAGELRLVVVYQDSTSLDLVLAQRVGQAWTLHTLSGNEAVFDGAKGFFASAVVAPTSRNVVWATHYVVHRALGTARVELVAVELGSAPPL